MGAISNITLQLLERIGPCTVCAGGDSRQVARRAVIRNVGRSLLVGAMPAARPREAVMQAGATECAIDTAAGAATSARRRNSHGNARRQPPLPHTNKFKSGNSTRKLNLAQQIANGLKTQGHWPPSLGRCQRMKGLGGTAEQRFELFRAMHRRQGAAAISNTSATVEGDSGAARAA